MRKLEEITFWREYVSACKDSGHEPVKNLRGQVGRPTLEITRAEAFSLDDWKPLLATLNKDNSLHFISVCASSTRYKVLEGLAFERDVRSTRRNPALYTKYVMGILASSLSHIVASSRCLTSILISKIPIKDEYLNTFCQGIGKTRTLQHLAFHHCPIEDAGCASICKALFSRPSLTTLDLSDCALTDSAATDIALLIKKQCCTRVSEVWKGSLRYGQPDGDDMPGLRRLTLNLNPELGDKGVKILTAALQDDIWIKGVDMQGCNVTQEGAYVVSCLLQQNQCITVFDLRGNPEATTSLPSVMAKLRTNMACSKPGPYKCRWMEEMQPPSARVSQMTLDHTTPSTAVSLTRTESSSNLSEPPWISIPRKPSSVVMRKQPVIKRGIARAKSLEGGVHMRLKLEKKDSTETVTYRRDDFTEDESNENNPPVFEESEMRSPVVGVSQEHYEVLKNFKKFTQSYIKLREANTGESSVVGAPPKDPNIQLPMANLGGGDYSVSQPIEKSKELPRNKKLEAGDAPGEDEDSFKEKAHQLLRKLIKLRSDRGLERNEGVMRVCSQLSLPEVQQKQNQDVLQSSASFATLPGMRKTST